MLVKIYTENPSEKEIDRVVNLLERDGVVIYPTDSVYAFGCSIRSAKAVERLRRIKGKDLTTFSVVFDSLGRIADYCRVDNAQFRLLKQNLPGPFTFLLDASSRMPHKALERRRTIGIRIPDNSIPRAIVERLGAPLLTSSVLDDEETEYMTDPELIHERYGRDVELVIDGGAGDAVPTTVVDLTGGEPEIGHVRGFRYRAVLDVVGMVFDDGAGVDLGRSRLYRAALPFRQASPRAVRSGAGISFRPRLGFYSGSDPGVGHDQGGGRIPLPQCFHRIFGVYRPIHFRIDPVR